jgi:curved DNA-binding protein CbpA
VDYYQILGISVTATADEVKAAYRRLVMNCHPDRHPGREDEFKRVNEAYDTLSDPAKRGQYNLRHHKAQPRTQQKKARKNPYTKWEERMAWIAANDPNMGNVRDVKTPGVGGQAPRPDWVDAFFNSYERGNPQDIRRGRAR